MKNTAKSQSPASLQKTGKPRVVLVGTYKGDQLEKWPGWYCWPLDDNSSATKNTKDTKGASHRATEPRGAGGGVASAGFSTFQPFNLSTFQRITELWLFRGTAEQRNYRAEFVGVKTREELIRDYGQPAFLSLAESGA